MRGCRLLLCLALAAACTDAGPLVGPGTLTATLRSPNGEEGAAFLVLVGEGVLGVGPVGETEAYAVVAGGATRVVLVHPHGGTLAFEVQMVDRGAPLVGLVSQVAGPDDALRSDLGGYRLELSR